MIQVIVDVLGGGLVGTFIGAIITYFVSRHFYHQATGDLRQEAEALRQQTETLRAQTVLIRRTVNLTAAALNNAKLIEAKFDGEGNVSTIAVRSERTMLWNVEASPPPRWKFWRR